MISALGIISGTSMDGIDVAYVQTDGETVSDRGPGATYSYDAKLRQELFDTIARPDCVESHDLTALEQQVTEAHVAAVRLYLQDNGVLASDLAVLGFHGQTVLHRPERRFTRQLFDGALAARLLGVDVVTSFRQADVAAGGQGAPLVPLYHRALVRGAHLDEPVMVLNLGGVGNVTYIDGEAVIAFDTGPASALLDDWIRRHKAGDYDLDGRISSSGEVHSGILSRLMADPYFEAAAPKSLDRNHFHALAHAVDGLTLADGAATLTAFTVAATAAALRHVPRPPARWVVGGGGRLNRAIMLGLATTLGVPVEPVEAVGWDGDHLEAECFGFLAVRSIRGLPLSLPTTTGAPQPMPGGVLFRK